MIGAEIKGYMDERGIKQSFLADKIDMPKPTLSEVLSEKRTLTLIEYYKICKVFELPMEYFFERMGSV